MSAAYSSPPWILLLLGRVVLGAQRPISRQTFPWTICRSVRTCVGRSVGLSSALWQNGGSDQDAVWHHRSDGSSNEAGNCVWGSVDPWEGVLLGVNLGRAIVTNGDITAYVCEITSQITLGKLVIKAASLSERSGL